MKTDGEKIEDYIRAALSKYDGEMSNVDAAAAFMRLYVDVIGQARAAGSIGGVEWLIERARRCLDEAESPAAPASKGDA